MASTCALPFSQHARRVEPRCAPCRHPRSQHAYGNQHSGGARERHRITCLYLEEQGRDEPRCPPAASQAKGESAYDEDANTTEDKAYDTRRLRAEGHAQPDLRPTRAHRLRHDAVEPESGEQERERAEESGHHRDEPFLRHCCVKHLIERPRCEHNRRIGLRQRRRDVALDQRSLPGRCLDGQYGGPPGVPPPRFALRQGHVHCRQHAFARRCVDGIGTPTIS